MELFVVGIGEANWNPWPFKGKPTGNCGHLREANWKPWPFEGAESIVLRSAGLGRKNLDWCKVYINWPCRRSPTG